MLSDILSKTPLNTNTSAPIPWIIVNVNNIIPITTDDATTCCQRKGSDVLFAYAHIEKAGEDCIPISANIYVIHIIPVQTPPAAVEPDDTHCIEPGIETRFENPSKVNRCPEERSFFTKSPIP